MLAVLFALIWLAVAFAAGSIPFGWIAARLKGIDIRSVGSGNIGGTNVWRTFGWQWGLPVLLADVAKGLLPLLALQSCLQAGGGAGLADSWQAPLAMCTGLAAVLGHTFTPWLRFRGGKGVATGLGVAVALFQAWVLIPLAVFALTVAVSRYISLGSMLAALSVAVMCLTVPRLNSYWPFGVLTAALIIYLHRSNLRRILQGTESKIGRKRQSPG